MQVQIYYTHIHIVSKPLHLDTKLHTEKLHSLHFIYLFYFLFFSWGETESTWYSGYCLAYCTSARWERSWSNPWIEDWQRNQSIQRKPAILPFYPPQILHALTRARGGKPETNRLSYGTDLALYLNINFKMWTSLSSRPCHSTGD
jgi:hypothetical protein